MATSSLNSIRVRLYFDYPPPATPECRMCWLLVDLNKCRVVADLSSIIKEKFGYGRKTVLDLFIEDCFLPSTESIFIVRDNDSVRVNAASPVFVNGAEVCQNPKTKKRGREAEIQICDAQNKKKKRDDAQINDTAQVEQGKKKKKKKTKELPTKPATPQKSIATPSSTKTNRKSTSAAAAASDKSTHAKNHKPSSSSSDSSEDEAPKKASPPKPKPKQNEAPKKPSVAARKESTLSSLGDINIHKSSSTVTPKPSSTFSKLPLQTPLRRESSTDSSSSSSLSSSPSQVKPSNKNSHAESQPSSTTRSSLQSVSSSVIRKPESSDSEDSEIELVIKKPNLQAMGLKIAGLSPGGAVGRDGGNPSGQERQGRGRGGNRGSGRGGFGRARGTPWKQNFHYSYENSERQKLNDSLTNESVILQNPPKPARKRDYAALPLLAAPPAVGQKIAFKLLELTENYTPEVSDYKEGKIIALNQETQVMELELLSQTQAPVEPGKFDLVYQNPDGSERVEYAVTHGSQLTERWDSLLEPRLIVENTG